MSVSDAVLPLLDKVRRSGLSSWTARCPAHDDRGPSLAIKETDDGRVLLHCFAGCGVAEVLLSIGLDLSDLFPPKSDPGHGTQKVRRPWSSADLVRLAGYEAAVMSVVFSDCMSGRDVQAADLQRMLTAAGRLADIAYHACVDGV